MIDDVGNCPYSYHQDFPGTFLYPDTVDKFVARTDKISSLYLFSQAVLYQLILLANTKV